MYIYTILYIAMKKPLFENRKKPVKCETSGVCRKIVQDHAWQWSVQNSKHDKRMAWAIFKHKHSSYNEEDICFESCRFEKKNEFRETAPQKRKVKPKKTVKGAVGCNWK